MGMKPVKDVVGIASQFAIEGNLIEVFRFGSGHINDTYCAGYTQDGRRARVLLQRINRDVFPRPQDVMQNLVRVAEHLKSEVGDDPDHERKAPRLIATRDGAWWHVADDGDYWRAFHFVERACSYDAVQNAAQAFAAAQGFGRFQSQLASLPPPKLLDVIPHFHDTPRRFEAFQQALAADGAGRASSAAPEIAFALEHQSLCRALLDAGLPERVTHNDAKINNVLFDESNGEALCVVDLDTVMPGVAAYDFGDLVRTATCTAEEDETNLDLVRMEPSLFEAVSRGYLSTAREFLLPAEVESLAIAGEVITFETGLRFLTDYLQGDRYFKVHKPDHNLIRCRTQFKLVQSIEEQRTVIEPMVAEAMAR